MIAFWNKQKEALGGQPYHAEFLDGAVSNKYVFSFVRVHTQVKGTSKAITYQMVNVYRIADGQLAEIWPHVHDLYAFDEFWSSLEPAAAPPR
jgi:hypothetical protein